MANFLIPSNIFGLFALLGTSADDNIALAQGQVAPYRDGVLLLEGNDSLQALNLSDNLLVNGNQGSDTLIGGNGLDTFFGGQDGDRLFSGSGTDVVYGNLGNDSIEGGFNQDTIYGGQGDDILNGDEDNDLIYGDRGLDIVDGDAGRDTLIGGFDFDTFVFDPGEASFSVADVDEIRDFEAGNGFFNGDKIALPPGTQLEPISLLRDRPDLLPQENDLNGDGRNDIILETTTGSILGIVINDGNLPAQLFLDVDFVFDNRFDFNL